MTDLSEQDITSILEAWNLGQVDALPSLVPLVYGELRRLASSYMRGERAGHTLETNALVHEAYLRLINLHEIEWKSRNHFLAIAARIMRRILIDSARLRKADKRGGDFERVTLDDGVLQSPGNRLDFVELDDAINALGGVDERKAKVIELRFFGGLSVRETADVLDVSAATVMRDWEFSKAWILNELKKQ
jgi:RNA polymerase sigma factor (TIGR02999 family)